MFVYGHPLLVGRTHNRRAASESATATAMSARSQAESGSAMEVSCHRRRGLLAERVRRSEKLKSRAALLFARRLAAASNTFSQTAAARSAGLRRSSVPGLNPVSELTSARMVDLQPACIYLLGCATVSGISIYDDLTGTELDLGHWLNGRLNNASIQRPLVA